MNDDPKMLLEIADRFFSQHDYHKAIDLYARAAFFLIFNTEEETYPKEAMTKTILCYQQMYPDFYSNPSYDYIQLYFAVVRHWRDHYKETDIKEIEEEIYRVIPFASADDTREELSTGEIHSNLLTLPPYEVGIAQGQGIRDEMEDAHAALTFTLQQEKKYLCHVFGVFDGHGGSSCSRYSALKIPEILIKELEKLESLEDSKVYHALIETCVSVDEDWKELPLQKEKDHLKDLSGSTAVIVLLIDGRDLWVANVGDSGSTIDIHGEAVLLTEIAKPTIAKYHQEIFMRGGFVSHGRVDAVLDMARSIGDLAHPSVSARPTIKKMTISKNSTFLIIACDGLWDVMDPQTALDSIKEKSAMEASELLRTLAYQRGSTDNVTIIVIRL